MGLVVQATLTEEENLYKTEEEMISFTQKYML